MSQTSTRPLFPIIPLWITGIFVSIFLMSIPTMTQASASGHYDAVNGRGGKHAMTLIELVDRALRNNPETRIAWDSFRSSEAGVALQRAGYWPQINGTLDVARLQQLNFSGRSVPTQTHYGSSISLSYLLWDFGTRSGLLHQAEFQRDNEELSKNQTLQDVILQVEQAYYQVLGFRAVVAANRKSLKDAQTNLDAVKERQSSGLATVGDVYKAEATLAGSRLALDKAKGQLAVAHGQLAVAVGSPPNTPLRIADWDVETKPKLPMQGINELLSEASNARPQLLAAIAQEKAATANLEAVRARGFPTVSFNATSGSTRVAGVGTSSQFDAFISLNVPVFSGFGDRAATEQAKIQLDSANANIKQLRTQVELQVWQAYQNLRASVASLDSSAEQLKSAQQASEVSNARYRHGLDTILDLLSAQTALANARVQYVQSRLDWAVSQAALGHAIGGLHTPASSSETSKQ